MLKEGFYQISEKKLGFGAYGSVFAATDITTKRQVACKIIDLCSIANRVKEEIHGQRQNESDSTAYLADYRRRMKTYTLRTSQEYLLLAELSHVSHEITALSNRAVLTTIAQHHNCQSGVQNESQYASQHNISGR